MTTPERLQKPIPIDPPLPPIITTETDLELPELQNESAKAALIQKAIKDGKYQVDEKLSPAIRKMLEEEAL
jgi:anti-sigma28 factor (negative regulator of flagellin synthesis)